VGVSTDIGAGLQVSPSTARWATPVDVQRLASGFFEQTWQPIVANQPDEVREHLDAERSLVADLLAASPYRTVVEAGCADGTLLAPVILDSGAAYLGLDVAEGAVRATAAALRDLAEAAAEPGPPGRHARPAPPAVAHRADIRDLPAVFGRRGVPIAPPVLVAFPFNVFGNIPEPQAALAAAAAVSADALVLTYDTSTGATSLREEYYRACGFAGEFFADGAGVHYEDGLFTSSVYEQRVVIGWLEEHGYAVTVIPYGRVGVAYHGRRGR
jgi:hypothetical protein